MILADAKSGKHWWIQPVVLEGAKCIFLPYAALHVMLK